MALSPTAPTPWTSTVSPGRSASALENVDRRQQAAARADVVVERDGIGQA